MFAVSTCDLSICVSDDYENGERYSAPFGGLFSCQQGNVLANKYYTPDSPPKMCPSGYSEHPGETRKILWNKIDIGPTLSFITDNKTVIFISL
jgi:hypothetical protein